MPYEYSLCAPFMHAVLQDCCYSHKDKEGNSVYVWGEQDQKVEFQLLSTRAGADTVYLNHVCAYSQGKGDGSAFLRWLISKADEHRFNIILHAERQETTLMSNEGLAGWYKKFGFVMKVRDINEMLRTPV